MIQAGVEASGPGGGGRPCQQTGAGKRRGRKPTEEAGHDEVELEAKLREMKAGEVVEHIAVCKRRGYCGYAKEDDDPSPDTPNRRRPHNSRAALADTHCSRASGPSIKRIFGSGRSTGLAAGSTVP